MNWNTMNRGVITFNPCIDHEWVAELCEQAHNVDGFHVCDDTTYEDGSRFVVFCDAETEEQCEYGKRETRLEEKMSEIDTGHVSTVD